MHRQLLGYGIAVLAVVLALALRLAIEWVVGAVPVYIMFYPAVMLSAVFCGVGPGVLATGLAALAADLLFLEPVNRLEIAGATDAVGLALFLGINLGISVVGGRLRMLRRQARQQADELGQVVGLLDLAPVMTLDMDHRILRWTTGCRQLYGFSEDQAIGQISHELLKTEFPESGEAVQAALLRDGRWRGQIIHTAADGARIIVASEWILWRDSRGRPARILETNTDIRERKRVEEALRRSEERLRATFENAGVGIVEVGGDDRFIAVNNRACQILRRSREQLLSMNVHELTWPEDRDLSDRINTEVHAGVHERADYEKRYIRGDGTPVWAHVNVSAIRDAQGRWIRSIVTIEDISEQKAAEEELRRWKDELEVRVQGRTAELAAANRELEAFGYTVSHDLRAPLRHITGFVAVLSEHAGLTLDEEGRKYLDIIFKAGERMGQLIDGLLMLSRIGRAAMTETDIDLRKMVDEVIEELADEARGRTIDWHIDSLPHVRGDRTLLRTVVANLIGNALKYTRGLKVARIEIGCQQQNGEVICHVKDNGAGFDMRYADKLFGVFQRLHPASEFEGTGIGLASVRRIIQRHGGRTWAEGGIGEGATFYFALPLKGDVG